MRIPATALITLLVALAGCGVTGPHPLTGKEAPAVELQTLDGDTRSVLPASAGAKAYLVDFWASWCGPCRYAAPMVNDLAQEFADQGLVVSAVNQGEPREVVAEYVADKAWADHVLLDPNGEAGYRYKVTALPTILLVDADGVIQAGYTGYSSSLHAEIRDDILAVLDGQSLIKPPAPS